MNDLVLEHASAGYGETVIIEDISLALPPGGTLAVLGRNGVGKTTLLATVMGHTQLRGGNIRFAGRDISGLAPYRRARLGIGFVPQEREIFPSLTVEENLTVAEQPGQWSLGRGDGGPHSESGRPASKPGDLAGPEGRNRSPERRMAAACRGTLCADRGDPPGAQPDLTGAAGCRPRENWLQGARTATTR